MTADNFKDVLIELGYGTDDFENAALDASGNFMFCPDQVVATIEICNDAGNVSAQWQDCFFEKSERGSKEQLELEKADFPTIVIVLESPHISEFDYNGHRAIGPASGNTGNNIYKQFCESIVYYMTIEKNGKKTYSVKRGDIETNVYCVALVNAVQFQCSLGDLSDKQRRDRIFLAAFKKEQKDFITRLARYDPTIIINACTKGVGKDNLQENVQCVIDQSTLRGRLLFRSNHPSSSKFKNSIRRHFR